jgi:hypothetical protein
MVGSIRLCLVALSLGLGAITTPAAANTITYNWFGVVEDVAPSPPPGVTIGKWIKIGLAIDDGVSDTDPSSEIGRYDANIFGPPALVLAVDIGGETNIGTFEHATVLNDHNGTDAFTVSGDSPRIGSVFRLDFSTSDLGVLTSDALPLSINPDDFDRARFSVYGEIPIGFSGRIVSQTPLPGSVGLLVSALTGLVGAGWWKSRA